MHPYRVSPVNVTESATSQPSSNGSNSSPQRRLATVSPSTSPRSHSFYGSSPNSNVPNSGQYWQPVANRNKFKTWSKGSDKKTPTVTLTSTSTSTTTNMTQNPPQPSMNSTPPQKPKRERPTTKSMSIQSFEAHQQKLEQNQTQMMMRASPPPVLHREQHLRNETRRPRSQSTNSSNNMKQNSKQTQFYRKKKPILVDAVTQTTIDACTQTSEDDFELAMSLYKQKPQQESFQPISAPSSTPSTNTVSTQTLAELPLPIPNRERLTGTASMQRSLSTNTMNIQINSEEFEELQKQLNKFQQQKDAILSKSRPLSFTAMPVPTAVKVNAVTLTVPQPQPLPPSPTFERAEQLGPSKSPLFHSADSVLNDLNDLEEEIAFMRYKALSLQESVQWLQREKSSRPIAPGPFPQVEFTDSKTLSVNTPKKVEPNKPEKRPNTPFDFMPDLQGPDQSKRQNIASPSSAFASGSVAARLNKTRMSQSLTALPDLKM